MRRSFEAQGFTLLEIVVALVLIGLLAGTLVPAVINQLGRGEVNRLGEDLATLEDAAKSFRTDVNRWPGGLDDLVTAVTATDEDPEGNTYPPGLLQRWSGPYLDLGAIPGDTIVTGGGAVIDSVFTAETWGSADFLVMTVKNVPLETARELSVVIDGDTITSTAGKVRWLEGDTLVYYATPLQ